MHKAIKCSLLFLFVLSPIILLNPNSAQATGTTLPSIISSDTTLTQNGSPYSIVGPTRVDSGVTLTLEAGSTLNIGTYYLQIDGTLRTTASSSSPAQIDSTLGTDISSPVGYINFTSSSTNCVIENTLITQTRIYLDSMVTINSNTINFQGSPSVDNAAIYVKSGTATITNNIINAGVMTYGGTATLSGNTITGGMGLYGGTPTVTNNKISGTDTYFFFAEDEYRLYNTLAIRNNCAAVVTNNDVKGSVAIGDFYGEVSLNKNSVAGGISAFSGQGHSGQGQITITNNKVLSGITAAGSNITVQGNQVSGIGKAGISISGDAIVKYNSISGFNASILINSGSPTIKNNNIQNWTINCIKNLATNDIDASGNWWGTTDTQAITQSIYDQKYDFNLGKVTITPILNAPDPTAPEILPVQASPTPTVTDPSPTPSVPEYSTLAILVLLVAATLTIIVGVRKLSSKEFNR